jgi:hypothetical protein
MPDLPAEVHRTVDLFLGAADELAPGLILALRTAGGSGHTEDRRGYRNPLARRRDALAFLDFVIDDALALAGPIPRHAG